MDNVSIESKGVCGLVSDYVSRKIRKALGMDVNVAVNGIQLKDTDNDFIADLSADCSLMAEDVATAIREKGIPFAEWLADLVLKPHEFILKRRLYRYAKKINLTVDIKQVVMQVFKGGKADSQLTTIHLEISALIPKASLANVII